MKKYLIFCVLCVSALPVFGGDMDTVATVKLIRTEPITVKQLKAEVEMMEKLSGKTLSQAERRQVLDGMINQRLLFQAAERDKVSVSDQEINQQINRLKTMLSQQKGGTVTDAEFAEAIRAQTGMDVPAYRAELKKQLLLNNYVQFKKGDPRSSVKEPDNTAVEEFYNLNKTKEGIGIRPDFVWLSMIQVPYAKSNPFGNTEAQARELANGLAKEIGGSAVKFDQAVIRAQGQKYMAADLPGPVPRTADMQQMFGSEFMTAVFKLEVGQVSSIIQSQDSFLIVKVKDAEKEKLLKLDDQRMPGDPTTVRNFIKSYLAQQDLSKLLAQIQEELVADLRKGDPFSITEKYLNY